MPAEESTREGSLRGASAAYLRHQGLAHQPEGHRAGI